MYSIELLIIYLTSIVILTAIETYKYKILYIPIFKNKIFLNNTLLHIIIIIPIVTEFMFTSMNIYNNIKLLIMIWNIIIMSILFRQYIIINRYKSYIVYIIMVCIHRTLDIYILKNNYIYSFILSSGTVILTLITNIYVYRTYCKQKRKLACYLNPLSSNNFIRTIRIRKRSVSLTGGYISESRMLNNVAYNIYCEQDRRIVINSSKVPDDIHELYDKFYKIENGQNKLPFRFNINNN